MPRKRRELAAVRRFVQCEQHERETRIVAVALEQRTQVARELRRDRNVAAHVGTEALEDHLVVVAQRARVDLHHQTISQRQPSHFHQQVRCEAALVVRRRLTSTRPLKQALGFLLG